MPIVAPGVYMETDEKKYEAEACYYLAFHIRSALYSLNQIGSIGTHHSECFSNSIEPYHYYADHLLYSIGQISTRFIENEKTDTPLMKERKSANRNNFEFTAEKYPILCNKKARNTIEHIDEYNLAIIENYNGVGGFNVILPDADEALLQALRETRSCHPYTLDLVSQTILIVRNNEEIDINLKALEEELLNLLKSIEYLKDCISNFWEETTHAD